MAAQRKYVHEQWLGFKQFSVPDDAPDRLEKQTRETFFAGACSLLRVLMTEANREETAAQVLASVQEELKEFSLNVILETITGPVV